MQHQSRLTLCNCRDAQYLVLKRSHGSCGAFADMKPIIYAVHVRSLGTLCFLNVFKEVSYAHQSYIYVLKNKTKMLMLWNSIALYQHIERISEGLCDTENWSNDAENWKLKMLFSMYFYEINAVLVSIRGFKTMK